MSTSYEHFKNAPARLPDISLVPAGDAGRVPLRSSSARASVVVLIHDEGCEECRRYLHRLVAKGEEINEWDGEVLAVGAASPTAAAAVVADGRVRFRVFVDPDGDLSAALEVQVPAVAIADRWGELRLRESAGLDHGFYAVEEVVAWLRYLAIECPECQGEAY